MFILDILQIFMGLYAKIKLINSSITNEYIHEYNCLDTSQERIGGIEEFIVHDINGIIGAELNTEEYHNLIESLNQTNSTESQIDNPGYGTKQISEDENKQRKSIYNTRCSSSIFGDDLIELHDDVLDIIKLDEEAWATLQDENKANSNFIYDTTNHYKNEDENILNSNSHSSEDYLKENFQTPSLPPSGHKCADYSPLNINLTDKKETNLTNLTLAESDMSFVQKSPSIANSRVKKRKNIDYEACPVRNTSSTIESDNDSQKNKRYKKKFEVKGYVDIYKKIESILKKEFEIEQGETVQITMHILNELKTKIDSIRFVCLESNWVLRLLKIMIEICNVKYPTKTNITRKLFKNNIECEHLFSIFKQSPKLITNIIKNIANFKKEEKNFLKQIRSKISSRFEEKLENKEFVISNKNKSHDFIISYESLYESSMNISLEFKKQEKLEIQKFLKSSIRLNSTFKVISNLFYLEKKENVNHSNLFYYTYISKLTLLIKYEQDLSKVTYEKLKSKGVKLNSFNIYFTYGSNSDSYILINTSIKNLYINFYFLILNTKVESKFKIYNKKKSFPEDFLVEFKKKYIKFEDFYSYNRTQKVKIPKMNMKFLYLFIYHYEDTIDCLLNYEKTLIKQNFMHIIKSYEPQFIEKEKLHEEFIENQRKIQDEIQKSRNVVKLKRRLEPKKSKK